MNMLINHIDLAPMFCGVVIFVGLLVIAWKSTSGRWFCLTIDIPVFDLIFKLHR